MRPFNETLRALFHELFPSPCLSCGYVAAQERPYLLCGECQLTLKRVYAQATCMYCGKPLLSEFETCLDCRADPPPFFCLDSLWWYLDAGRDLLQAVKFDGDRGALAFFAEALQDLLQARYDPSSTILVPLPPHPASRARRGFDVLEKVLGAVDGYSVGYWLRRRRGGRAQKELDRKERQRNLASQLVCAPGAVASMEAARRLGKTVVMVDDLFTTGASLRAAGDLLLQSGLNSLRAVVLFRD